MRGAAPATALLSISARPPPLPGAAPLPPPSLPGRFEEKGFNFMRLWVITFRSPTLTRADSLSRKGEEEDEAANGPALTGEGRTRGWLCAAYQVGLENNNERRHPPRGCSSGCSGAPQTLIFKPGHFPPVRGSSLSLLLFQGPDASVTSPTAVPSLLEPAPPARASLPAGAARKSQGHPSGKVL